MEKHRGEMGEMKRKYREEVGEGKRRQGEAVKVHQQRASKKLAEQCQATADAQKALHDATNTFNTASQVACSLLLTKGRPFKRGTGPLSPHLLAAICVAPAPQHCCDLHLVRFEAAVDTQECLSCAYSRLFVPMAPEYKSKLPCCMSRHAQSRSAACAKPKCKYSSCFQPGNKSESCFHNQKHDLFDLCRRLKHRSISCGVHCWSRGASSCRRKPPCAGPRSATSSLQQFIHAHAVPSWLQLLIKQHLVGQCSTANQVCLPSVMPLQASDSAKCTLF